jgi:hypothetical protein
MRTRFFLLSAVILLGWALAACDDTKTYAEQLAEEKVSIQQFIKNRGYIIAKTYPDTIPFPENVFYKTESGLYIHVLDTGKQVNSSLPDNKVVLVRFLEENMDGDTTYMNLYGTGDPYEIYYNNVQTSVSYGDCQGWHEPLEYVGDGGHVYVIVPSKLGMSMYSSSSSSLTACFYELRYTFCK